MLSLLCPPTVARGHLSEVTFLLCSESSMAPTALGIKTKVLTVTHKTLRNSPHRLSPLTFLPLAPPSSLLLPAAVSLPGTV